MLFYALYEKSVFQRQIYEHIIILLNLLFSLLR